MGYHKKARNKMKIEVRTLFSKAEGKKVIVRSMLLLAS